MKQTALRIGRQLLTATMVVVLVALTACAAKPSPTPRLPPPPPPPPLVLPELPKLTETVRAKIYPIKQEGTPSLEFFKPLDGAINPSSLVGIDLIIKSFNYLTRSPGENVDGMGGVVVYLDVEPPTEQGKTTLTAKGTFVRGNTDNFRFSGVKPGKHTIYAQLVNNDNTPLNPPVVAKINITVVIEASPSPSPK